MKKLLFLLFVTFTNIVFANKDVYVLIWGSTQTKTGAGHSSLAFKDSLGFHYFSHYPTSAGGSLDTTLASYDELTRIDSLLNIQLAQPQLVLTFNVTDLEFDRMKLVAEKKIKKSWTLFGLNCSDFVKQVFRKTDYDVGYAFCISTPYEMVWDIRDHNINAFQKGKIKTVRGLLYGYLTKQPKTVPYTIKTFFLGKKH